MRIVSTLIVTPVPESQLQLDHVAYVAPRAERFNPGAREFVAVEKILLQRSSTLISAQREPAPHA
jgi:hypothetical protein